MRSQYVELKELELSPKSLSPSCSWINQSIPLFLKQSIWILGVSQVALVVKNLPAKAGNIRDSGLILGLARSSRGEHGNLL